MTKRLDPAEVERLAALGLTYEQISQNLGISTRCLYNQRRKNSIVADAIKRGQAKGIEHVSNKLRELIDSGNVTATIFFLKARAGWNEKEQIELAHVDSVKSLEELTDAELMALVNLDVKGH